MPSTAQEDLAMAVYPLSADTGVPAQPSFPGLERDVLKYWQAHDTFRASVRQRPEDREVVFYDRPPFRNGLPHYGHLITRYVKDLVYQGFKVLPYCWRCETPLSNHELRMDEDTYAERQDPSVTVRFRLEQGDGEAGGEWLLAWTTTPWTLPSNLACAVGADISYVVVAKDGERYILARDRLAAYEQELAGATEVGTVTAAELAGRRYEPLFGYLADAGKIGTQDAFRLVLSDDVTTEDGTTAVHIAPAYGAADALACHAAGIPTVLTVDSGARLTAVVPDFEGQHVFDANAGITAKLPSQGS